MWEGVSAGVASCVTTYPKTCIFTSLLVTSILTSGLVFVKMETDIRRSFSPEKSDSFNALPQLREAAIYKEFYNLEVYPSRSFMLFYTKDHSNILSDDSLAEVERLDNEMMKVLRHRDAKDDLQACYPLCDMNFPFHMFLKELRAERAGNASSSRLFDYPRSTLRGAEIFIGMNIFGVDTVDTMIPSNHSKITRADTIIMHYFSRFDTPQRIEEYKTLTLGLFEASKYDNTSSKISFNIFGEEIANVEMIRGAFEAIYLMTIGFVLLLIFVTYVIIASTPKRMTMQLVAATVITPMIATIAAFGVQCWIGFNVYSIQCVTPFLVLGIGVDDAFILVHWWSHYRSIKSRDERMRQVLIDVGPSITITSLTNIVAFGIGFLTPTPQMSLFCLTTSIALFFDYLITYSILAPVVYICANKEEGYRLAEQQETKVSSKETAKPESPFLRKYAAFLCTLQGRALCTVTLFALYVFSAIGVYNVNATFDPSKAFPADSVLVNAVQKIKPVFNEFFPLSIYVNHPPNISDATEYKQFYKMVSDLEELPMVYGGNRTVLFLAEYEKFDRKVTEFARSIFLGGSEEYAPSLHNLGWFLNELNNPPSIKYRRDEDRSKEGHLEAFQMTIIAKGMHEWSLRAQYEDRVRTLLKGYPQFNATIFDPDSAVLGVILTVRDDLIGSICLTVACMACVCLFFIRSKMGVVFITFTISSICFCLIGLLSWWNVDLDPVMQVDVLLATGFSVDYTAHIAYQYYTARGRPEDKLYRSLSEMAAPMIQAGMSTVLCMLPLIFIQTYTINCFAKTVFIVVGCGVWHGLIVLPVLLGFTDKEDLEEMKQLPDVLPKNDSDKVPMVEKKAEEAVALCRG